MHTRPTLSPASATGSGAVAVRSRPAATIPTLLKWPGGKTAELPTILAAAPPRFDRYFEPFVGGGAVWLAMPSDRPAFVNDASVDLVAFYEQVRRSDERLFGHLAAIERWWQALQAHVERRAEPLVTIFRVAPDSNAGFEQRARRFVDGDLAAVRAAVPDLFGDLVETFAADVRRLVPRKMARMRTVEVQRGQRLPVADVWSNLEGAYKAACYTTLRSAYNAGRIAAASTGRHAALFFFLREYAYAAMFRFNAKGEFNVPYGGISYNRKDLAGKIAHLRSDAVLGRLATTTFGCEDFASFLERHAPVEDDFVFLDPPYNSDFSDYDGRDFSRADHERLAAVLRGLPCRFQLVIKSTPTVRDVYGHHDWQVLAFDKTYLWTIKQRNDRRATHLLITNTPTVSPA